MSRFRIGITRDVLDANGAPTFGTAPLAVLNHPGLEWEYLPEPVARIAPAHLARYDALYINAPLVTRETFAQGNGRTRIIARHGVGYDSVDVAACTENGVILTIQPDGVRRPVAVAAITYVLALSQKLLIKDRLTRAGRWGEKVDHMGIGLVGRTLGLIGAGNIGREIMRLAPVFGLRLLVTDPYLDPATITELGGTRVDLDTLLQQSDFVVIACLLNEQTRHMIGARELALMRPTAYLVNMARGPIIDESALIAALRDRRIAGAGIDVFETEPVEPDNPLLTMENTIVTPHALCWTDQCFSGLAESGFRGIVAALAGQRPNGVVNPEVFENPQLAAWLKANAEAA
jgi:phosphoglycerate dehydrogenase-like enzyme